jgi:hypothetical protein
MIDGRDGTATWEVSSVRKLAIFRESDVAAQETYPAPLELSGLAWSKLMSPPDYGLWLCLSELEPGARMSWPADHGDEVVYLRSGSLAVAGHACVSRGAVIVEANVAATLVATERSLIAHWGSRDIGGRRDRGTAEAGHRVHVVGPGGIFASGDPGQVAVRGLADGSCESCDLALFEVTRNRARSGRPHSHGADEIIFVTDGSIRLGSVELHAGTSLCIPGGTRYAEGSGPEGAVFLNYRPHVTDRTDFAAGTSPVTTIETLGTVPGTRRTHDVVHLEATTLGA